MTLAKSVFYSKTWAMWFQAEWLATGELSSLRPVRTPSANSIQEKKSREAPGLELLIQGLDMVHQGLVPNIRLLPAGTRFQAKVRALLWRLSPGFPVTYGKAAEMIGSKGGARAVGQACSKNNYLVLVPCHRIIGASGLGGFNCWGVSLKRELLLKEGAEINPA